MSNCVCWSICSAYLFALLLLVHTSIFAKEHTSAPVRNQSDFPNVKPGTTKVTQSGVAILPTGKTITYFRHLMNSFIRATAGASTFLGALVSGILVDVVLIEDNLLENIRNTIEIG